MLFTPLLYDIYQELLGDIVAAFITIFVTWISFCKGIYLLPRPSPLDCCLRLYVAT